MWGINQEIINYYNIVSALNNYEKFINMLNSKKEDFLLRLKAPYPIDVTKNT